MAKYILIALFSVLMAANINDNPTSSAGLTSLIEMTSDKPFIYRVFLPQVGKTIADLLGVSPHLVVKGIAATYFFGAYLSFEALQDALD